MSGRGKDLLILAGLKPKRLGADEEERDDNDDDDGPPSSEDYAPSPETVDAGQEAIDALHAKDAPGFASAMCKLIDAHETSKKGE